MGLNRTELLQIASILGGGLDFAGKNEQIVGMAQSGIQAEAVKKAKEEQEKKEKSGAFGSLGGSLGSLAGVLAAPFTAGTSLLATAGMGALGGAAGSAAGQALGGGGVDPSQVGMAGVMGGVGGAASKLAPAWMGGAKQAGTGAVTAPAASAAPVTAVPTTVSPTPMSVGPVQSKQIVPQGAGNVAAMTNNPQSRAGIGSPLVPRDGVVAAPPTPAQAAGTPWWQTVLRNQFNDYVTGMSAIAPVVSALPVIDDPYKGSELAPIASGQKRLVPTSWGFDWR